MSDILFLFIAVLVLLFFQMTLVICEICLVKIRYRVLEDTPLNHKGKSVTYLIEHGARVADVIRFGQIVWDILFGAVAFLMTVTVVNLLGFGTFLLPQLAFGACLFSLFACLWYLFSNRIPRSFAFSDPEKALAKVAWLVSLHVILLSPILTLVARGGRVALNWSNRRYSEEIHLLDVEVQIRALGSSETTLSDVTKLIVKNGLRLHELQVSDVMLPRNQVQYFDTSSTLQENIQKAQLTGHTRFPLCDGDLDNCLGIVHIKDIFRYDGELSQLDLKSIKRKIVSVSSDELLENALKLLLDTKRHMAIVTDEFGGAEGVVTLENIFEQLVGQINDEFDTHEEEHVSVISHSDFKVDGLTPIHDLEEKLAIQVENDEVSTFGGLITSELGRFPENGEELVINSSRLLVKIDEVDEKRIISATVKVLPQVEADADELNT